MILADKIILLRKKSGMSQEELAEKMGVSRQSVSKWEGAQSMPDISKILQLSEIFGVSTDYLLKEEIEEKEEIPYMENEESESGIHKVSMEEASEYLNVKFKSAKPMALATFLCIISPVCLIILGAASEQTGFFLSEDAAGGIGVTILLAIIAVAIGIFIYIGNETECFEYMEKEAIETAYGVSGMVKKRQEQYKVTYTKGMITGTCICVLSAVPIFMSASFTENDVIMAAMLGLTFFLAGIGVVCCVLVSTPWNAMQTLLQKGNL